MRLRLAPTGSARRKLLRSMLSRFPFIGESWLLPRVVGYFEKGPMWPWYRRLFAKREARRINRAIDSGTKHVSLVYDCGVCPLAFGDYLQFVMIMRFLGERGVGATLYVLDSDIYPSFRSRMSDKKIEESLQGMIEIATSLLSYPEVQAKRVDDLEEVMQLAKLQDVYVVCAWRTRNRRPLFHHGFNIFNHLMASASSELQDRVLLSISDLAHMLPTASVPSPCVTWGVRYSLDNDPSRNLTDEEFLGVQEILRNRHPSHTILVVSDEAGCQYYSKLVRENGLKDTVFSKDYSPNILGDAALILQSDLYYVLRGGGISVVPWMSRLPYRTVIHTIHENLWNAEQLTSWQGPMQVHANGHDLDSARATLMDGQPSRRDRYRRCFRSAQQRGTTDSRSQPVGLGV